MMVSQQIKSRNTGRLMYDLERIFNWTLESSRQSCNNPTKSGLYTFFPHHRASQTVVHNLLFKVKRFATSTIDGIIISWDENADYSPFPSCFYLSPSLVTNKGILQSFKQVGAANCPSLLSAQTEPLQNKTPVIAWSLCSYLSRLV